MRPPPGLKGREIGLWYARNGGAKKRINEVVNRQVAHINKEQATQLAKTLQHISNMQVKNDASYSETLSFGLNTL